MSQVNSSFKKHDVYLTNLLERLEYDKFYSNYLYGSKVGGFGGKGIGKSIGNY